MNGNDFEIIFGLSLFLLLGFLFVLGLKGRKDLQGEDGLPAGEAMRPFLFLYLFYVNPDDPRSWLPKSRPSWGWTVNFRSKTNACFFLFLLIMVVGSSLALTLETLSRL